MPDFMDRMKAEYVRGMTRQRQREEDPEGYDRMRREEATAWRPQSDSDYRADEATRAASTGDLFDPTQDPRTRYDAIANNGNNLANYTNRGMQVLNRGMGDYERRDEMAAGSRARADQAATGRPTYQIPTYTAPEAFTFDQQRTPLQTDADIADRYRGYGEMIGLDQLNAGTDYQAERVGDYGQAFQTWLTGAQSSFGKRLQEESNLLKESAAARGRLNTGFYDEDYGKLARGVAGDFSDAAQMAALDAAGLSLRGAEGNANRALDAARLRGDRADAAYRNNLGLLDRSLDRSAYLDQAGDARFEDDRNFAYDVYGDARDFGRDTFEDDRNFGYGAFRDSTRDFENDRNFWEDRYRFDEGEADDARNFYADWLTGMTDRRTDMTRYQDAQPKWWEKAAGIVAPVVGTILGGPAGGAVGASVGRQISGNSRMVDTPVGDDEEDWTSWYDRNARNA